MKRAEKKGEMKMIHFVPHNEEGKEPVAAKYVLAIAAAARKDVQYRETGATGCRSVWFFVKFCSSSQCALAAREASSVRGSETELRVQLLPNTRFDQALRGSGNQLESTFTPVDPKKSRRRPKVAISRAATKTNLKENGKDRSTGRWQRLISRKAYRTDLDPDSHTSPNDQPSNHRSFSLGDPSLPGAIRCPLMRAVAAFRANSSISRVPWYRFRC
jgi:hypothetical protein